MPAFKGYDLPLEIRNPIDHPVYSFKCFLIAIGANRAHRELLRGCLYCSEVFLYMFL